VELCRYSKRSLPDNPCFESSDVLATPGGMESPKTAEPADDSYCGLDRGGSVRPEPTTLVGFLCSSTDIASCSSATA
jgi:hypothetical protein